MLQSELKILSFSKIAFQILNCNKDLQGGNLLLKKYLLLKTFYHAQV